MSHTPLIITGGTNTAEYVFIDEWDVHAPINAVFEALADARTYPKWWTPVYLDVESDGPPAKGVDRSNCSRAAFRSGFG